MACKQGIRQSMEASRAYYQQLKLYDPHRELWKSLVTRSSIDPQLQTWTPAERVYFCVSMLEGEIYNGGIHQFFWNSSGNYYNDAHAGLRELNAENCLVILQDAADLIFNGNEPPVNQVERQEAMDLVENWAISSGRESEWWEKLNVIDKKFYEDPDKLVALLQAYAETRGLVSPFMPFN